MSKVDTPPRASRAVTVARCGVPSLALVLAALDCCDGGGAWPGFHSTLLRVKRVAGVRRGPGREGALPAAAPLEDGGARPGEPTTTARTDDDALPRDASPGRFPSFDAASALARAAASLRSATRRRCNTSVPTSAATAAAAAAPMTIPLLLPSSDAEAAPGEGVGVDASGATQAAPASSAAKASASCRAPPLLRHEATAATGLRPLASARPPTSAARSAAASTAPPGRSGGMSMRGGGVEEDAPPALASCVQLAYASSFAKLAGRPLRRSAKGPGHTSPLGSSGSVSATLSCRSSAGGREDVADGVALGRACCARRPPALPLLPLQAGSSAAGAKR